MADQPRLQNPYPNQGNPRYVEADRPVPKGRKPGKVDQAKQAVKGLVGTR